MSTTKLSRNNHGGFCLFKIFIELVQIVNCITVLGETEKPNEIGT